MAIFIWLGIGVVAATIAVVILLIGDKNKKIQDKLDKLDEKLKDDEPKKEDDDDKEDM